LYNGQVWKGLAYLAVTSTLVAGIVFQPESEEIHPGVWPAIGAAVWGASIADAAYHVHRREEVRPRQGVQVSGSLALGGDDFPQHAGLSADLVLRPGISIGLDRIGYTPQPGGGYDFAAGSRVIAAIEGERWRPGALVGLGVRTGRTADPEGATLTRTTFSAGAQLRYYVVPRYFVETDARWEGTGDWSGLTGSVGFGLHLGR
jgi:hypothetical protein